MHVFLNAARQNYGSGVYCSNWRKSSDHLGIGQAVLKRQRSSFDNDVISDYYSLCLCSIVKVIGQNFGQWKIFSLEILKFFMETSHSLSIQKQLMELCRPLGLSFYADSCSTCLQHASSPLITECKIRIEIRSDMMATQLPI